MSFIRRLFLKNINANRLRELGACSGQIRKFREIFGDDNAPLTKLTALAHAQDFSWQWAAQYLLNKKKRDIFRVRSYRNHEDIFDSDYWEYYDKFTTNAVDIDDWLVRRDAYQKRYNEAQAVNFASLYLEW